MAISIPPTTNQASPQTHGKSTNVAIADIYPPVIRQQNIGSVIEAEVLNLSNLGLLEIRTKLGNLTLSSGLEYSRGEKLLLQLLKFSPKPNFLIRRVIDDNINGKIDAPINKNAANSERTLGASLTSSNKNKNSKPISQEIRGSVQSQTPTPSILAHTHSNFSIGQVFKARILEFKPGDSKAAGNLSLEHSARGNLENSLLGNQDMRNIQNGTKNTLAVGEDTSRSSVTPIKNGSSSTNLIGSEIQLKILFTKSDGPLGSTPPPNKGLKADQILQAQVVDTTKTGKPIVRTPIGDFLLKTSPQINLDKAISIEFVSGPQLPYTAFSGENNIISIIESRNWPALNEALELIRGLDGGANQLISDISLPRVGSQLAANILFFISALRGGDLRSWLGNEAVRRIQESRPNLYSRLNEEFNQLARPLSEVNTNDWRTAIIPILNGSQFEYLKMHLKGESDNLSQDDDGDVTRFIIDLDLSKLGRIQLDGLITAKGKHFDLFIRSEAPIEKSMRRDLNKIFIEFMEITGISGKIVFHSTVPFIIVPAPYSSPEDSVGVIV